MTARRNTYPGTCIVCGASVAAQAGNVIPRDAIQVDAPGHGKWVTLCASALCAAKALGQDAASNANARELRADGAIVMPYDAAAAPLLKAIATWDGAARCWRASMLLRDRDVVLAVADKLGLAVDASLREYEDPEPVRLAVERARAVPTIREYQVQGVRWLAYRGTLYGAPEQRDTTPGALECDHQGLGKTMQVLFSVHDDEAVLVVCTKDAKAVWPREAAKWRPGRFDSVHTCTGTNSFRWPRSSRELVVINYDVLPMSPAQIRAEREKLMHARFGREADPNAKRAADRKKIVGYLQDMQKLVTMRQRLLASKTHPERRMFAEIAILAAWVKLSAKLHANRRALIRNAKRRPCGKPPCKVLLVADEADAVENNKAQRTVAFRHVAKQVDRLYGLTGTPVESLPLRLLGLLTSLRCNPFSWNSFREQFNAFDGRWGGLDFRRHPVPPGSTAKGAVIVQPGTAEILSRVLLRRTKDQVLPELPAKIYSEVPVDLSASLLKQLDEAAALDIDDILAGRMPSSLAEGSKLRKLLAAACLPTALELAETYERAELPLIMFSAHVAPIEALGKRKGWAAITGNTSATMRGKIQDDFQAGKLVGVAGTNAMARSMTLTAASTVVFIDRFLQRKLNEQAEDRAHRIGQADAVNVIVLVPQHPYTEHAAALLSSKDTFVDQVLTGSSDYVAPPSRCVDEDQAAWQARVDAKQADERERVRLEQQREQRRRERELAKLAAREVSAEVSEQRAKLRAERLQGIAVDKPLPVADVQAGLAYMLAVCDGAREKDDAGFNAPDAAVARWLAPGVQAGSPYAVASMLEILRHYPQQLAGFPELFNDKGNS